jgi:acetylornithine deacetylase/succinyl-diaminopimelate desuccinylase-like protein
VRSQVERAIGDPRIQRAFRFVIDHEPEIEADQIRLTSIPAPPFGEGPRAEAFAEELQKTGLRTVIDGIGNVIAPVDEFVGDPLVIAAHLDTVFPRNTPLELRRKDKRLFMPGISDNGSGLVALLWALRAVRHAGLSFRRPIVAVANVGEEGEGNLRGARHIFQNPPWEGNDCRFIALDVGGFQRITHQALGSRRFRVRMTGPGGHSWADFGRPNPVHAMAGAVQNFITRCAGRPAGTSFNVGVIRGGISVNAIPTEAVMEIDLRSITFINLAELNDQLQRAIHESASAAHVECSVESMGERPSGVTPIESDIVQAAIEVTRQLGAEPVLDIGSTDANIPMSMGIPSIAIGGGGRAGNTHTPEEWFDPTNRALGLHRLLVLMAVLGELAERS